ncbi:hypothetical protein L226DRAFT_541825 [Lentinus tigrinus ALCF2SS1-7]|uniref:uncharacterized protein n=1 Tax=Lentinus tigrinus ALCF2SS1-7 TaxID=1328758 RepID=UPI0011661D60|nr:hypothetical protein L226DRAFT_541825 [Lentinus tigrinus ALCF2SS1-7]
MGDVLAEVLEERLNDALPHPAGQAVGGETSRFRCFQYCDVVEVLDDYLALSVSIPSGRLESNTYFDFRDWYAHAARRAHLERMPLQDRAFELADLNGELADLFAEDEINAVSMKRSKTKTDPPLIIERNASEPRDFARVVPKPIIVSSWILGKEARTLLDTGSLSDFITPTFARDLGLKVFPLAKQIPLNLAVKGSRAKISYGCIAEITYQEIRERRYFDVAVMNYDIILGTPFIYQHQMHLSMNPTKVVVGSVKSLPIAGKQVRMLESCAAELFEDHLEVARRELRQYAESICQEASDSPLPPLRAINHTIPLKDESKIYHWRPSKCPDALRPLWIEKRDAYLKSGRWRMSNARNTSPMLLLTKPGTDPNRALARPAHGDDDPGWEHG